MEIPLAIGSVWVGCYHSTLHEEIDMIENSGYE